MQTSNEDMSVDQGRKRFAKNTVMQYGLQIAKYIFPFVTIPYLTRVLGPETYAVRAYVLATMTIMQMLLEYGFNAYGTKEVAERRDSKVDIGIISSSIVVIRGLLSLLGMAILAILIINIPLLRENYVYVLIAYLGIVFKSSLPDFIFQGLEEMGIITYRYVASQAVALVCIIVFIHGPQDLILIPIFETLASIIAFIWSWHNVLVHRGIALIKPRISNLFTKWRTATAFFLSNAATTVFSSLTTLMIGIFIDDVVQISYWSISMMAITAIQSLYTPVANSLYPHMVIRKDFALAKRLIVIGVIACGVGTIAYAYLAEYVMLLIGGEQYIAGSYLIAMTSPVLLLSYPVILLGMPILAAMGRVRQLTLSSIFAALFHIIGLFVLLGSSAFTIVNIAVLRSVTEAVCLLLRIFFVSRLRADLRRDGVAN